MTKGSRDRGLKLPGHDGVLIKPARAEIDSNRIWALRTAEELIKASPLSNGKVVSTKKDGNRGIYVGDERVFSQEPRYSTGGTFLGAYSSLKLP